MDKFTGMINKQELRIGNWVSIPKQPYYDEDQTGLRQVADIDSEGINYLDHGSRGVFLKDIEPIWINFDEMDAAGFEEKGSHGGAEFEVYNYEKGPVRVSFTSTGVYSVNVFGNQIYYGHRYALHQLQNLWYAIHGEELEVKLPV
jgi:hypothetical protein